MFQAPKIQAKPLTLGKTASSGSEANTQLSDAEREWGMDILMIDPSFDPLRDDPRFQNILRRMNFPE